MKSRLCPQLAVPLLYTLQLPAQDPPPPANLALNYWQTVSPHNAADFEQGLREHMAWRKEKGDPWVWNTWQLIRGQRLGLYFTGSPGHTWADLDNEPLGPEAGAHYWSTAGKHVESLGATNGMTLTQWSHPPTEPPTDGTLGLAYVLRVHPDKAEQFQDGVRRFHEAVQKAGWDTRYVWTTTVTGGPPDMVLVIPTPNWASMAPSATSPQKVVEKAFGEAAARVWSQQLADAIASETVEVWLFRPDLSHVP